MSKKKMKQSTTMEDHVSLRYRDGEGKEVLFDKIDYEVSSILLELSRPVVFSSDSPSFHQWGHTKKRSNSFFLHPPDISPEPAIKSLQSKEVGEMGSTSSSSCLTGEAKKTNPESNKKGSDEEFSTTNQRLMPKVSSQPKPNASCSVLEEDTGLIKAQVGFVAQPIPVKRRRDVQNLRRLQPLICVDRTANMRDVETASLLRPARDNLERRGFDLNLPAAEEGNNIDAIIDYQRAAAAQARQRRLGLIRSKKLYSRFISLYQFK